MCLFHGAVVVHEDEGTVVLRVGVALGALVAGTEVALSLVRMMLSMCRPSRRAIPKGRSQGEWFWMPLLAGLLFNGSA